MTPEFIFKACSMLALAGWIMLIFLAPFWYSIDKFLIGVIIAILAIVYAYLIVTEFEPKDAANFNSLDGVMKIFTNKTLVTAGWIHYLAFDLFVGVWIKKNSMKHGIPHLAIIPALLFTFMLGPLGFLIYTFTRWIVAKQYFAENYGS